LTDEGQVVADACRGIEIDHLDFGEPGEPAHPPEHIIVPDREALALNELHDGAALEID
jgi:hypothetical protein